MKKNDLVSNKRVELVVRAFIEQELTLFDKNSLGFTKKYFRYVHLGNRLIRKINATRNGIFKLQSKEKDIEMTIKIGESNHITKVGIKNNELWFKQS